MDTYKKWNIGLSIVTTLTAGGIWLYWEYFCIQGNCSWEIRNFLFRPLLWGSLALSIISSSLLFFPPKFFKLWLLFIASWSIPLALYFILGENPYSSSILSPGRGLLSWIFGIFILLITMVYAIGWHLCEWRKGKLQLREFSKLGVFAIAAAIFYAIWQLF